MDEFSITTFSAELRKRDLTSTAKLLFGYLCFRVGNNSDCWPSLETIGADLGITKKTAGKAVELLIHKGYIAANRGRGRGHSNRYVLQIKGETITPITEGKGVKTTPLIEDKRGKSYPQKGVKTTPEKGEKLPSNKNIEREHRIKTREEPEIPAVLKTEKFLAAWKEWQQYRKESGKPIQPTTASKQLDLLSKHDPSVAAAMLRQSITMQWQGIFELKNTGTSHVRKQTDFANQRSDYGITIPNE